MNVLLTTVSGRSHFVDFWRAALGRRGLVLAADASPTAPALHRADRAFVVPRFTDPAYVPVVAEICAAHDVRLVVPATDNELPALVAAREQFREAGTTVLVSDAEVVDVCLDKWRMVEELGRGGVQVPRTWSRLVDVRRALDEGEVQLPLVVKPRWGSGSLLLGFPCDQEELALQAALADRVLARARLAGGAGESGRMVLFQERLGGLEYGLDVVNDLSGRYVTTLVRRKLKMVGGRTEQAVSDDDPRLVELGARLGRLLGHRGVLDCDVMVDGDRLAVIDLNPRFGGGYAFSHLAGADLPRALLAWLSGDQVEEDWLRSTPGVVVAMSHDPLVLDGLDGLDEPGTALDVRHPTPSSEG